MTPFTDRLRLAGTMEFAGLDEDVNDMRVGAILRAPAVYLRDWTTPDGSPRPRAGMRPMTPDGLAVIGRLPGTGNAYVSTGTACSASPSPPGAHAPSPSSSSTGFSRAASPFDPARPHARFGLLRTLSAPTEARS